MKPIYKAIMKPIHKAIAGVFAATALLSGVTFAQVRYESRAAYAVANPASLGVIKAIYVVGTGGDNDTSAAGSYRIRVQLDSGNYRSVMENDLGGLRVGDRIQIDNNHVFPYRAASEHYDSGGNPDQSG